MRRGLLLALALLLASVVTAGPATAAKPSSPRGTGSITAIDTAPYYWGDTITVHAVWSGIKAPRVGYTCWNSVTGDSMIDYWVAPDWHDGQVAWDAMLWGIGWSGPRGHTDCLAWIENHPIGSLGTRLDEVPFTVDDPPTP